MQGGDDGDEDRLQLSRAVRIAVVTNVGRVIGGLESYLSRLIPALVAAGHEVALWYDYGGASDRPPIDAPPTVPRWDAEQLGFAEALGMLRRWAPDVIFSHGLGSPTTERVLLSVAPGVLFAHAYYGACISGWKSRLSPTRAPCSRPLGWPCLVHYLPRRCGGLNPARMVTLYQLATRQRDMLHEYQAIVTASPHMRAEYTRYGLPEARIHVVDLIMPSQVTPGVEGDPLPPPLRSVDSSRLRARLTREWRLLFVGRLTELKGAHLLIDALRHVRGSYAGRIAVTIVGEGPAREELERQARDTCEELENVSIRFAGWLEADGRASHLRKADLLVIPSVWPEPFGLVGPEAGLFGVPAAAFRVGGIPAWLADGVNGHLAPGARPVATGLAATIIRCLQDPGHYARLRTGALEAAHRFTVERHLAQLLPILDAAAKEPRMISG